MGCSTRCLVRRLCGLLRGSCLADIREITDRVAPEGQAPAYLTEERSSVEFTDCLAVAHQRHWNRLCFAFFLGWEVAPREEIVEDLRTHQAHRSQGGFLAKAPGRFVSVSGALTILSDYVNISEFLEEGDFLHTQEAWRGSSVRWPASLLGKQYLNSTGLPSPCR